MELNLVELSPKNGNGRWQRGLMINGTPADLAYPAQFRRGPNWFNPLSIRIKFNFLPAQTP